MSSQVGDVAKVLFGEDASFALAEAFGLIEHEEPDDGKLLNLMIMQSDAKVIAKITMARVVRAPSKADFWLCYLRDWVFSDAPAREDATGHLVQGVALGLFEAAVWFDQEWNVKTNFQTEFPDVCAKMITGKNRLQQRADDLEVDSVYTGRLTNAVKAYAKETKINKGMRLAQIQRIIKQVADYVGSAEMFGRVKVGALGNLVLDQLTFAQFSQLVPYARAVALGDWFTKFLEKDLGLPKEKLDV